MSKRGGAFALGMIGLLGLWPSSEAEACGCFAPPDVVQPVVQAAEYVLFAHDGTNVTMHVQIQYDGRADEFGWLIPLPSVPDLDVGLDEIFIELESRTRPTFRLDRIADQRCVSPAAGARDASAGFSDAGGAIDEGPSNVLVERRSVGPFDTAVLRADDRSAMLRWLDVNGFFIPDALGNAVGPYIRTDGYFLALKLQSDKAVGDIEPLVMKFEAELPMIPIILTSVGASENMPMFVWVLGEERAIPRNYRHTVINEEHIDWFSSGRNYRDIVSAAVDEAEGGHSFVTEYAGTTTPMHTVFDGNGRFGERITFETTDSAAAYTALLRSTRFPWSTELVDALRETFPMPEAVRASFDDASYYANLDWFLGVYRDRNPEQFEGVDFSFDPLLLTARLWTEIVEPRRSAGALFRAHGKITRLFTTLSPDEMTADPVFSFNPDLPDVSNLHVATYRTGCESNGQPATNGTLELPDGRTFQTSASLWRQRAPSAPFSQRIEMLREEGPPEVEVDNAALMSPGGVSTKLGEEGCACTETEQVGRASTGVFLALVVLFGVRRRTHQ